MELTPPPGYQGVVVLDKERHKGLAVRTQVPFGAGLNAVYVTATEFALACRDYPLIFLQESSTKDFVPMVLTGLSAGSNLFVGEDGLWDTKVYVPAYVRRYPFCVAEANQEDGQKTSVICVDDSALESSALPLFDKKAEPTTVWQTIEKFINDMETARQQTNRMTRALDDLDLLEPFEAQAALQGGEKFQLKSMFRVSEQRLNKLPSDVIQDLMAEGSLARIYLHIASLNNFSRLVDRAATAVSKSTTQ